MSNRKAMKALFVKVLKLESERLAKYREMCNYCGDYNASAHELCKKVENQRQVGDSYWTSHDGINWMHMVVTEVKSGNGFYSQVHDCQGKCQADFLPN